MAFKTFEWMFVRQMDVEDFDSVLNYYHLKTEKLLNFGVEKVIAS